MNITKAGRELATNLRARGITIKHVQALDLLAAGAGIKNRQALAALPFLPDLKAVHTALLTTAATVIARHDLDRRNLIIAETSAVLLSEAKTQEGLAEADDILHLTKHLKIRPSELGEPESFCTTPRGTEFIEALCDDLYYERYSRDYNSVIKLDQGNKIAASILEAKRSAAPGAEPMEIEAAIAEHIPAEYVGDYWFYHGYEQVLAVLQGIADDLDAEHPGHSFEPDEWIEALQDPICEHLVETDDSAPSDLLGRFDQCEILFFLIQDGHTLDEMISSNRNFSDFSDLHIGPELQHPLSRLGYTISEYRALSRNRNASEDLRRGLRKRPQPLLDASELKEIVENASASNFLFAVYAIVSLPDLINLDLSRPATFNNAAIATYNPYTGTFMDVSSKKNVTVEPFEGRFESGAVGYSPDDICGLVHSHYFSELRNSPETVAIPKAA